MVFQMQPQRQSSFPKRLIPDHRHCAHKKESHWTQAV